MSRHHGEYPMDRFALDALAAKTLCSTSDARNCTGAQSVEVPIRACTPPRPTCRRTSNPLFSPADQSKTFFFRGPEGTKLFPSEFPAGNPWATVGGNENPVRFFAYTINDHPMVYIFISRLYNGDDRVAVADVAVNAIKSLSVQLSDRRRHVR